MNIRRMRINLKDFVVPLRIENVPYNQRIGINRYNVIDFIFWGEGLKKLFMKFEKDYVPKYTQGSLNISDLLLNKTLEDIGLEA